MLYREIIAVCSEIHTKKHINTMCGQNVEFANVKNLVVHIVTTEPYKVRIQFHALFYPGAEPGPRTLMEKNVLKLSN
jgi:hypothetical protein